MSATTPMMQQYEAAKRACPDALMLYQMSDRYELFYDAAKTTTRAFCLG